MTYWTDSGILEEKGIDGYSTLQKAEYSGPFPMVQRKIGPRYLDPNNLGYDGYRTLKELATSLAAFNSDWINNDWVTPQQRAKVLREWEAELIRLNPTLTLEEPLPKGQHILLPDDLYKIDHALYREIVEKNLRPARKGF